MGLAVGPGRRRDKRVELEGGTEGGRNRGKDGGEDLWGPVVGLGRRRDGSRKGGRDGVREEAREGGRSSVEIVGRREAEVQSPRILIALRLRRHSSNLCPLRCKVVSILGF